MKTREYTIETLKTVQTYLMELINLPEYNNIIEDSAYISGSSISSLYLGEIPKDIDVFFKYQSTYDLIVNELKSRLKILSAVDSVSVFEDKNTGRKCAVETRNAFTILGYEKFPCSVQLIKNHVGLPEDMISDFDFIHCKAYYDFKTKMLTEPQNFLDVVANKTLIYCKNPRPINSLLRMNKFVERGWKIQNFEIIKIAVDITELNLKDPESLAEILNNLTPQKMEQLGVNPKEIPSAGDLLSKISEFPFDADSAYSFFGEASQNIRRQNIKKESITNDEPQCPPF